MSGAFNWRTCTSPTEYAEAVRAWRNAPGATPLPEMAVGVDLAGRFTEEHLFAAQPIDSDAADASVALSVRDDPFCILAAGHAVMSGKQLCLVDRIDDLPAAITFLENGGSVTFCLSPQECARQSADRISDFFRDAGIELWGLLSGLDLQHASRLVSRIAARHLPKNTAGTLYCGFQSADSSPHLIGLAHRNVQEEPMPLEIGGPPEPFSYFRGHGRSHCGLDGNICTKKTTSSPGDPTCIGRYECMFPSYRRIPAHTLAVDFCVLDVCAPAAFRPRGPEKEDGFNLALHLLAGTASCVLAPFRYHSSAGFSPFLAWHLVQSGASTGRLLEELNCYFEEHFDQHPPYILLGDPDMIVADAGRGAEVPCGDVAVTPQGVEITAVPGSTQFYPLDKHQIGTDRLHFSQDEDTPDRCIGDILRIGGRTGLLMAWDDTVAPGPCRLHFGKQVAPDTLDRHAISDWISNAKHLPLGVNECPSSVAEALATPAQFERFFVGVGDSSVLDASIAELEKETMASIAGLLDTAAVDLLTEFRSQATVNDAWLPVVLSQLRGMTWARSRLDGDCCPYCDGTLLTRRYRVGYFETAERIVKECEYHLLISDRPNDPLADLRFDLDENARLGETIPLQVTGRNTAAFPLHLAAVVSIVHQQVDPSEIEISPEARTMVVAPGAAFELSFSLRLGFAAWAMGHNVQAILLCNGAAMSLYRQVQFAREKGTPSPEF
jgi:hypothetical protein